jgi:acetyl-CoA synthetase
VRWATIQKAAWPAGVVPNVVDYDATRAGFPWANARRCLDGLPKGSGLNLAYEAVDQHTAGPQGSRTPVSVVPSCPGGKGRRRHPTNRR